MTNPILLGVDYSAGYPSAQSLVSAEKQFVCRYAVLDWRGIKPLEITDLRAKNLGIVLVHEADEDRLLDGYNAGVYDAQSAQNVVNIRGLDHNMVIYFAADYDFSTESQRVRIIDYMRGAISVLGLDRVGIYGGYTVIEWCHAAGVAAYFWQTSAWEYGRGLHQASNIYQNAYNKWIGGVNCDLTNSYKEKFGAESEATHKPPIVIPAFPKAHLPEFYDRVNAQKHPSSFKFEGLTFFPERSRVHALAETRVYTWVDRKTVAAEPVAADRLVTVDWITKDEDDHLWLVNGNGYYYGSKFDPYLTIPKTHKNED